MKRKVIYALIIAMLLCSACGQKETTDTKKTANAASVEETEHSESTELLDDQPLVSEQDTSEPETELLPIEDNFIVSHKDEYAEAIYNAIVSLPADKPESSLKQKDVDCDTLQWFNATYSMFTYHSGADYHHVGGYSDETGYVDTYVTSGLDQSWGITDRATAIESIAWLAAEGHVPGYVEVISMMDELYMLELSDYDLRVFLLEILAEEDLTTDESENIINYYTAMKAINEACGENGVDAWDYCRIMQLCGSCYYAGYLTLEESLSIQLVTAQAIQNEFDSWEAMNTSYLKGYGYWAYGSSAVSAREWAYQKLTYEDDCPFTVLDFNMPLEKFW